MTIVRGVVVRTCALALCLLGAAPVMTPAADAGTGPGDGPVAAKRYRTYLAVGDSLTNGAGTTDPATKAYPAQADVRGHGVDGACVVVTDCPRGTRYALDWWPAYLDGLANPPHVAVFAIGVNDIVFSSASEIVSGLAWLRRQGRDRGVDVVFATITPAPDGDIHRSGEDTRRAVNRWVRGQHRFVEYARPLQCRGGTLCPRYVSPVWGDIHLSDRGSAVLAERLVAWIRADRKRSAAPEGAS
jgi:lysophospholipase L1-like esterase